MRWLLQELAEAATTASHAAVSAAGDAADAGRHGASGLVSAVTDAASSLANSATEAASELATELGSTVAASVVEANARAGHRIDSATAMPIGETSAARSAAGAGELMSMGDGSGPQRLPQHLDPPAGMWHGHGRLLSVLVAAHALAFLYWVYLYVVSRKLETARGAGHARRVLKNFKCVYEFAVDKAVELMPMRKKPALSPSASPRVSPALLPAPHATAGASANVSLKSSPSMTFMNKYFKGDAP